MNAYSFENNYKNTLGLNHINKKRQGNVSFIAYSFDDPLKQEIRNNIISDLHKIEGVEGIEIDPDTITILPIPTLAHNKIEKIKESIKEIFRKYDLE